MPLFIANWKTYLSYQEAISFAKNHRVDLEALSTSSTQIVLAPSFVCIDTVKHILKETSICISAQDCSPYASGAYTGEVEAISLAQVGCAYAIIGHSERRYSFGESHEIIAAKAAQLFESNITPIICIGETSTHHQMGRTVEALASQLTPLLPILTSFNRSYCIAYEPIWSIGTGKIADPLHLATIFAWILEQINFDPNCTLIYGGSVTEENAKTFLAIPNVGGLLIGRASCNFQSLKKIVS